MHSPSSADRRATAHAGHAGNNRQSGITLSAPPFSPYAPLASRRSSTLLRTSIFREHRASASSVRMRRHTCGLATFTAALSDALSANGVDVERRARWPTGRRLRASRVIGELVNGSATSVAACAELLNQSDVAVIQHEYGIYGGVDGDEVVDIIDGSACPVDRDRPHGPQKPDATPAFGARGDCGAWRIRWSSCPMRPAQRLCRGFDVDRRKVTTIPHGATVPTSAPS